MVKYRIIHHNYWRTAHDIRKTTHNVTSQYNVISSHPVSILILMIVIVTTTTTITTSITITSIILSHLDAFMEVIYMD
jgi:Flp pilus assembly protein TadG